MSLTRFVCESILSPKTTGAIAPSSSHLAKQMVNGVDWAGARTIIEVGPGTGAFTGQILDTMPTDSRYAAVEINPELSRVLRRRFPQAAVHTESVVNLARVCQQEQMDEVDVAFSGLPWTIFPVEQQRDFMKAITDALSDNGQFNTFAYISSPLMPAGRRFRKMLPDYFSQVATSRIVWRNLPPAIIYRCRR